MRAGTTLSGSSFMGLVAIVISVGGLAVAQAQAPAGAAPGQAPSAPDGPQVTLEPGPRPVPDYRIPDFHVTHGMILGTQRPLGVQIHGGTARWQPGGFWRWRNVAIRELP